MEQTSFIDLSSIRRLSRQLEKLLVVQDACIGFTTLLIRKNRGVTVHSVPYYRGTI